MILNVVMLISPIIISLDVTDSKETVKRSSGGGIDKCSLINAFCELLTVLQGFVINMKKFTPDRLAMPLFPQQFGICVCMCVKSQFALLPYGRDYLF